MIHDEKHDELLTLLLADDLTVDSPAARRQLEGCVRCREQWTALSRLARRIDELDSERRDVMVQAARRPRARDAVDVAAGLERLRAAGVPTRGSVPSHASRPRRRRRWIAVLAASLALVFALQYFVARSGSSTDHLLLGSTHIEAVSPLGAAAVFDAFEWRYALPPGGKFELVIADANAREIERKTSAENRWHGSAGETDGWPDEIRWRVIVYDAGGGTVASSPFFAARRSR
ncbi:MAG: hypothetical protein ACKVWV_07425 [Planctomycetota bacterium]